MSHLSVKSQDSAERFANEDEFAIMRLPTPENWLDDLPHRNFERKILDPLRAFIYDGLHHSRSEKDIVEWIRNSQARSVYVDYKQRVIEIFMHLKEVATRSSSVSSNPIWTLTEDIVSKEAAEKEYLAEEKRERKQKTAKRKRLNSLDEHL